MDLGGRRTRRIIGSGLECLQDIGKRCIQIKIDTQKTDDTVVLSTDWESCRFQRLIFWVAIVLPLVILAASLWHDWVEEGQSPRARKIMKDWKWNIDEMAHAVNVKGRLIGYRVLQAGVIIYLGYSRFFCDYRSIELSVLAIVSIVAEVLFIIIKTIRNMAGDEDKTQMWKQMGHSVFNNLMYL